MQVHPKQRRSGKKPTNPSRQLGVPPAFPTFQHHEPEQGKQPANNVRTRIQMNHRSRLCQQHERDRQQQSSSPPQQLRKQRREDRRHQQGAQPDHSVQSASVVQNPEQDVVKPLPGKPGLPLHGRGKRIAARKRVGRQNLLARPDVPSDIGIPQRPVRQWPRQQRPKEKNENDVPHRRHEKTQCGRIGPLRYHECEEAVYKVSEVRASTFQALKEASGISTPHAAPVFENLETSVLSSATSCNCRVRYAVSAADIINLW